LSFAGMSPADTMSARAIGTSAGSALALLAYIVWPTWERGRVGATLADLLDAYRRYFGAVLGDDSRVRVDVRAASRRARTNAQASLDRLRGEPRRDRRAIALAEGVFANANRFLRAAMTLEALRQSTPAAKPHAASLRFAERVDAILLDLAQHLRDGTAVTNHSGLRPLQSDLQVELETATMESGRVRAAAWIDASDRITDAVNTIAHLLLREAEHPMHASG